MSSTVAASKSFSRYDACSWIVIGSSLLGQVIRFIQNRGLRYDECRLALNIIDRDYMGLTRPLDHMQAAPLGFLWVEKAITIAFGNNEFSLRLLPLLAGLASPILFWSFARYVGTSRLAAIGTCLMSMQYHLLLFSGDVKQYSLDVAISTFLLLLGSWLTLSGATVYRLIGLALAGSLSIWFSHASLFELTGVWPVVAFSALVFPKDDLSNTRLRPGTAVATLAVASGILLGSFLFNYWIAIAPLLKEEWTKWCWSQHFAPFPPASTADWIWYLDAFENLLITESSGVYVGLLLSPLFIIGLMRVFRTRPRIAMMLVLPIATALIASAMKRFGFAGRQLLFLFPSVAFPLSRGIECAIDALSKQPLQFNQAKQWPQIDRVAWSASTAIFVFVPLTLHLLGGPWHRGLMETKPAFEVISSRIAPGDIIYVMQSAQYPFRYYSRAFRTADGTVVSDWPRITFGEHEGMDSHGYNPELDRALNTHPDALNVWVLSARLTWLGWGDVRPSLQETIVRHGKVEQFDFDGVVLFHLTLPHKTDTSNEIEVDNKHRETE